jgi:mRNA (guanine-N7-)-methyltransferase
MLIDIGVGRGGDMFKWRRCKVRKVLAYDIDPIYIQEAHTRYNMACMSENYQFHTCPSFDYFIDTHITSDDIGKIPIISCQFVIHYFFQTADLMDAFMSNVYRLLKPGGYFVGTFMCGDKICDLTKNLTQPFKNENFQIHPNTSIVSDFGTSIDVYLSNTLYFGEKSVSTEYLVKPAVLESKANEHGLKMVDISGFETFYESTINMSEPTQTCSFMYSTFVFQKTS